ncbi:hypothetical protein FDP41_012813 [Naegleria fowleri]|uniref:SMP-30/Gluconolactonase/LRE-like region domain-containing protein n=1 Tax=Naegleria fowleri TaxID=5763 RepID=A0A6A5C6B8_NAEFO|nr:uncharacterized protein FDP41_012813 [Naegleria fowleri]KAF0981025.1 hypothetical protein FDP41_012813 [Naegleria fowleri]CAG4719446.1 unnamed protein product [Naegleria fowleri]
MFRLSSLTTLILDKRFIRSEPQDENKTEYYLRNVVASNEYFIKLKEKMMKPKIRKLKSFSMNFELMHTLGQVGMKGSKNDQFNLPTDVKISYSHNVILVTDMFNHRIQVFHAKTKQFMTSIQSPSSKPLFLCVQEKYNGSDFDALLFDCTGDKCVYKYDLHGLLLHCTNGDSKSRNGHQEYPYIWKSVEFLSPQGIAIFYSKNQVYVCNKHESICVLDVTTGILKQKIKLGVGLSGIFFTNDEQLLLTEWIFFNTKHGFSLHSKISKQSSVDQNDDTEQWEKLMEIKQTGIMSGEFSYPSTIIFDNAAKHILLSDFGNNRVQCFDLDGNFISSFGEMGVSAFQLYHPEGMCLNEETGELMIVDQYNHCVKIFK